MARYGRSNPCIIKTETADGVWSDTGKPRPKFTTWCGETSNVTVGMEKYPFGQRCTKCSAKFYASITPPGWTLEKIDTTGFGYRSEANAYHLPNGWKSIYLAKKDGQRVGLIMIDNGWGQQWEARKLGPWLADDNSDEISIVSRGVAEYLSHSHNEDGTRRQITVGEPIYPGSDIRHRAPMKFEAKRFNSKEQALFHLAEALSDGLVMDEPAMMEEGRQMIIRRAERLAQKAIDDAERERWRQEREAARAAEAQRAKDELDLIAIAFAEMVTEGKISNFQREAVFLAAKRLGIEGLDNA